MNSKYLYIVLLSFLFVMPKESFAQEEINLNLMSTETEDEFYDDEYDDDDYDDDQIIVPVARTLQDASPTRKIYTDEFKYKWYIQAGLGSQFLMGEDDSKGAFASRLTIAPNVTGGYRWNPIFGVRLNLTGGSLHGYNDGHAGTYRFWKGKSDQFKQDYADKYGLSAGIKNIDRWDPYWTYKGWNEANGQIHYNITEGAEGYHWAPGSPGPNQQLYFQHLRYISANTAITMQLFNLIGEVNDSRKFDMSLFMGPSIFHVLPHNGVEAYTGFGINGGVQAQYHLSDKIGLFAEFNGVAMPDGFDGQYGGATFDLVGQAMLGVTYKFPTEVWTMPKIAPIPEPTDDTNDDINRIRAELMAEMNQIVDLQPEIDRLRAQLAALTVPKTVIEEKEEVVVQQKESYFLPDPVHFVIGKSDIDAQGWRVIETVAAYLNENPDASVIVTGYADKATGSDAINERLSKERSMKVADALHYRFNIPQSRIAVDWRGDQVQPFFRNQMNRAVLFYIEFH